MIRLFLGAAFLATMVACGGGDDGGPADAEAQRQAVNAVMVLQGDITGAAAPVGDSYDCGIALTASTPVPGRCLWTAEGRSPVWIVTFRETWACNQFALQAQAYPDCTNNTGFHEWKYQVDLSSNRVDLVDETGQFPPDYAE